MVDAAQPASYGVADTLGRAKERLAAAMGKVHSGSTGAFSKESYP